MFVYFCTDQLLYHLDCKILIYLAMYSGSFYKFVLELSEVAYVNFFFSTFVFSSCSVFVCHLIDGTDDAGVGVI